MTRRATYRVLSAALVLSVPASAFALESGSYPGSVYRTVYADNLAYQGVPGYPDVISITHHGMWNAFASASFFSSQASAHQFSHFNRGHLYADGIASVGFGQNGLPVNAYTSLRMETQLVDTFPGMIFHAELTGSGGYGIVRLTGPSGFELSTETLGDTIHYEGTMPSGAYTLYAQASAGLDSFGTRDRSFSINWTSIPAPGPVALAVASMIAFVPRRRRAL